MPTTRVTTLEEIDQILERGNSIIGSPLAELAWGPVKYSDWPTKKSPGIDPSKSCGVETLLIYGIDESAKRVKEDFLPKFVDSVAKPVDFNPPVSFQDMAKQYMEQQKAL